MSDGQKKPTFTVETRSRASSGDSTAPSLRAPSLKSPRTARFAEATAVDSPVEAKKLPFSQKNPPTNHYMAQPQPSDVGFGYMNRHESVEMPDTDNNDYPSMPKSPLKSPLKSAMKTPGAPPRDLGNIMSPKFREEEVLEKRELATEKQQAQDLKIKTRVRVAKLLLRGVNFSCSLIVVAMLATVFTIFNATKALAPRNSAPPWAENQKTWPQIVLLVIACISLFACLVVFYAYWKGGHRRAEKAAVYYTAFAAAFFVLSIVMWGTGAGILQGSKNNSDNKDMWGWACVDNQRKQLFQNDVNYDLVCRLQNWSIVCCVIEIVVETITIAVYGIVFYRFYSKRQLRKSMATRDRARSDLYLAQLRSQSAPNTPGLAPPGYMSPREGGWKAPTDYYSNAPDAEEGSTQYVDPVAQKAQPRPFQLQAPPIKIQGATPKMAQVGFAPIQTHHTTRERSPTPPQQDEDQRSPLMAEHPPAREQQQGHFGAAPGEQVYESVPIPGAYGPPLSPGLASPHSRPHHLDFPASPRR
ncbi:hypothetical protein D0869_01842 [Hortaea werneckii]|uniref:MARVEL domain-containing protein n=1 Tax=Hortaea werneckii TaxID=91943 RepID=A0A3M6XBI3_HORWE|nr:hypothetical protein KC334_g4154 [Hortaea werneckii]KAI7016037.1 hypothetical protein KC355_g4138 [Hortaea werneckii]KAI7589536.1 hypothetical protein KC316_g3895 [Hortaea werneckii]KAI7670291.1 hypothetical protein KC318_g4127 [Hortaea werneckii]RMX88147.1 hypothetical protein D0869_01842 [Hortaea werneckii]